MWRCGWFWNACTTGVCRTGVLGRSYLLVPGYPLNSTVTFKSVSFSSDTNYYSVSDFSDAGAQPRGVIASQDSFFRPDVAMYQGVLGQGDISYCVSGFYMLA
jgi:hypothetical protein